MGQADAPLPICDTGSVSQYHDQLPSPLQQCSSTSLQAKQLNILKTKSSAHASGWYLLEPKLPNAAAMAPPTMPPPAITISYADAFSDCSRTEL